VPPGWEHPRDEHGRHIPLFDLNADPHEEFDEELPGTAGRLPAMPRWAAEEATCYQVYENVTEGTPVSPVFDSLDDMRGWLVDQCYSHRAAEGFCRCGRAPTLVLRDGTVYPDVESAAVPPDEEQPP